MQISPIQNYTYNYRTTKTQPNFTGNLSAAEETVLNSKLFSPVKKSYAKMVIWLTNNYYAKLAKGKIAGKFISMTNKMSKDKADMTKHMAALGATLISGMYVVRTLQNDKLDKEKRKTLAINDAMTWAISTAGAYTFDKALGNWCDDITTRYAANYFMDHPESKNVELLGDWKPENIKEVVKTAKDKAISKYEEMKKTLSPEELKKWLEKVNMKEKHFEYLKDFEVKNISDLNTQLLKNELLDKRMRGIGVFKTLFVFGMVYRYVVPVLVMKPANWIGNYLQKKNAEKQQAQNSQKA